MSNLDFLFNRLISNTPDNSRRTKHFRFIAGRCILAAVGLFSGLSISLADEGMWMMNHLTNKDMEIMKGLGLKMKREELYNPKGNSLKDAVVDFGDFCSGVIVSENGLVMTNHHCGFNSIQAIATPENDILKNGFAAQSYAEEIPAEGLFVRILQRTDDVTSAVNKKLKKAYRKAGKNLKNLTSAEQEELKRKHIDAVCVEIEEEYTKKYPGCVCYVSTYYSGNAYYVNVYKEYDDIRLVFAPPRSLGKFGGETDNWMWPRQTCDFSVFRIYTDKNNQPAAYSKDNVPMKAENYAKVSLQGYQKGDYCMTIGYPGSTNRYLSSFGIKERMDNTNASRINVRGVKQGVWKKWMNADPVINLQYSAKYAQSANYWKNSIGMNKALKELKVVEQKQDKERLIAEWLQQSKDRQKRFGAMLPQLEKAYGERHGANHDVCFLNESFLNGPEIIKIARYYKSMVQNADPNAKALWKDRIRQQYKDWNEQVDRETMIAMIDNCAKQVSSTSLPAFYKTIEKDYKGNVKAYVDALYRQTLLADTNCLQKELTADQMDADMAFGCMRAVMATIDSLQTTCRTANLTIAANERLLCQAVVEMEFDRPHYSDANSTMRLSYGFVNDYTGMSGHQNYFTTMPSLLDKIAQGDKNDEYKVEPSIAELFKAGDFGPYKDKNSGEMQLCFLTNNDITGGNSGSPMFNGNGELIGLAFDGNWDAMSNDISFTQELTRCIGVDIRFVLYIIDHWGHCDRLIKEINPQ